LLQQRITSRQQDAIELVLLQDLFADRYLIDAEPDRPHRAGSLELMHGTNATAQSRRQHFLVTRAVRVSTQVMHQQHVDLFRTESLHAVFERAHDTRVGIVEHWRERQRPHESI
jgi:hypothetical protein